MQRDKATGRLTLSATDLSSFLSCRHRTALEMGAAKGRWKKPAFDDPQLEALLERGREHEEQYVDRLKADGASQVVDLSNWDKSDRIGVVAATIAAMKSGVDVIVQGALGDDSWYGRPDILKKVVRPSDFGDWSYEAVDAKLALETRAGSVLQLSLYSDLLTQVQGVSPECLHVVTPLEMETWRVDDFAAYFRLLKQRIVAASAGDEDALAADNYPEPVAHCDICPWFPQCDARRRSDDHLSLVAGISRMQRRELEANGVQTMAALAKLAGAPLPFTPKKGSAEALGRVADQASLQVKSVGKTRPEIEWLTVPIPKPDEPLVGMCRLPAPSPGDIFIDLEGDPFAGPVNAPELRGREYLFGVVTVDADGTSQYQPFWAKTAEEEKTKFEAVLDLIAERQKIWPGLHVYHYAPYEPSAFKRLMGRHATHQGQMDALLRGGRFIDLYRVVKESLRIGIERYSIKNLEPLYEYKRDVDLGHVRANLTEIELAVERDNFDGVDQTVLAAVQGYNRDDCVSLRLLRDWLEQNRQTDLPRPELKTGEASADLDAKAMAVELLRGELLAKGGEANRLAAYLLDYHRREDKSGWWEYFRLRDLSDADKLEESKAVAGLEFVADQGPVKDSRNLRFSYAPQLCEIKEGDALCAGEGKVWGKVAAIDRETRTIDVVVGPSMIDLRPPAAFAHKVIPNPVAEAALTELGLALRDDCVSPVAASLLNRKPPSTFDVLKLLGDVLAIQGPPGTGKTYNGGKMICDLVAAGKRVGVTGSSHKVIDNLLKAVSKEAAERKQVVTLGHKDDPPDDPAAGVKYFKQNSKARAALAAGEVKVLGGTEWLWPRPEFVGSVDVLFVDEAGQVSLADVLAMCQATKSIVLLGDPQQLAQVTTGSHPPGVAASALEHVLGPNKTMPAEQGVFLERTYRFGGRLCQFTSELFYEDRLKPTTERDLERQVLAGGPVEGAGLFVVDVRHNGNRNGSDEEVEVVANLVARLTAPGSTWTDHLGAVHPVTPADIRVISPYNVQVSRLKSRLGPLVACGTVDKFQGQEAPVVVYSMATSAPEDAPRGLEFLYSLNRFNVATSRAQCVAIVVCSPALIEASCSTPRHVQLVNALCRYRESGEPLPISPV